MKFRKPSLYICGKISAPTRDEEIKNLYKFYRKEQELKKLGLKPYNPASYEVPGGDWDFYLARDLEWMYKHRTRMMMYVMPGGEESRGLRLELAWAKRLGIPVFYEAEVDSPIKYEVNK